MNNKIKAVYGSVQRYKDVQKWLEEQGATNIGDYSYNFTDCLYYVRPDGKVGMIENDLVHLVDVQELPQWRAKQGEKYFYVTSEGLISAAIEDGSFDSSMRYNAGNYFQTDENAVPYREKFIKLFRRNRWK